MPAPDRNACRSCGQAVTPGSRFCNHCGAPTSPASPMRVEEVAASSISPGDVLEGKWRIEKKVGEGGMGSVYLATDIALERKVAIKALASELCSDQEFVARFEREAKLTAHLDHPNVVLVHGVGRHRGRPLIIMKYIEGETLSRRLARSVRERMRGLDYAEVLSIADQLCAGLGYIHSKGFVHRDIKTGNIIVGDDGRATILDFGILRDTNSREALTKSGVMLGTPYYISPEQALGQKADHRADLYALGIMLYEMLSGSPPFHAESDFEIIEMHVQAKPPDLCRLDPRLDHAVCEVLARSIAKKPEDRYQTANALYEALAAAFRRQKVVTRSRSGAAATVKAKGALPSAAREKSEEPDGGDRPTQLVGSAGKPRTLLWAGLGMVALLAAGLAVFALLQAPPAPEARSAPLPKPAKRAPAPKAPGRPEAAEPVVVAEDDEYEYVLVDEEIEEPPAAERRVREPDDVAKATREKSLLKQAIEADPSQADAVIEDRRILPSASNQ